MNAKPKNNALLRPRNYEVWLMLSKAKNSASLDLIMMYHQVKVKAADCYKTAFIMHKRLFVYNLMLFGLCNAQVTFKRLIERVPGA